MIAPSFAEIVSEARRHLEDAEEVLRLPWHGDSPTEAELDALDEARGHIATARGALSRVNGEEADVVPPRSRQRAPTHAGTKEVKAGRSR